MIGSNKIIKCEKWLKFVGKANNKGRKKERKRQKDV